MKENKNAQYIVVIILYIVAYIYSIHFAVHASKIGGSFERVNSIHESCVVGCNATTRPLTEYRGANYYIGNSDPAKQSELGNCLVTFWSMSHFLLYSLIGFFAPDLFWDTFLIGAAFELYEKHAFDCHDAMDVVYNSAGFLAGKLIRKCAFA